MGAWSPICGKPFISQVNGARKVKSNAQVVMNENSEPEQNFFLAEEDNAATRIFPNFWIVQNESRS